MRQPLAAIILAQDEVAAQTPLVDIEIVDADGLAVVQADDQVVALPLHARHLITVKIEADDAGGLEIDDIGGRVGDGAGCLGDDLGLHGVILPFRMSR